MTADTNTPLLGFLLQGTGNNNNAWGQNLNDQVIQLAEDSIAGQATIVSTGGTYTLNAAEARASTLILGNTLASDLVIVVPNTAKIYRIANFNPVTGFFTTIRTSSGVAPVSVPNGKIGQYIALGGEVYRGDRQEVGRYVYDAIAVGPDSLECDGSLYKRASLPDLYAKLGSTYGSTDSTNFRVPNSYDTGRYLRSRSAAVAVATSQSNQNKSHTHTGAGTTTGASVGHTHTGAGTTTGASATHTHTGAGTTSGISADHSHTFSGTTATESTTHTHTTALGLVSVQNGTGASQGNLLVPNGIGSATTAPTGNESVNHTHTYSGTTSGVSVDHTHTYSFTTAVNSVDHTHTYSFTTSGVSVDHTHTYSFTTSTGSADGTEARPESLVAVLCIRY